MKAAICTKYGPPEVVKIEERPKPSPKDNEILVRVRATTVASGDCRVRGADVPALFKPMLWLVVGVGKPRQPIFGTELSGEVEAVGKNVTAFKIGDSVFAMTGMKMGAHAEYITLPEKGTVVPKPSNITHEQAAAISFGGTTALHFIRKGNLQKGQRVLIYGASGAVGTSAVQLAKHFGVEVTGVCSGANMELVKSLGADRVIDYTAEDFRTKNERYDVIFDAVGKITKSSSKGVLASGGRYVTVNGGPASERIEDLRLLGELAQSGKYSPVIDRIYPIEQIVDAHAYVDTGRKKGNVVCLIYQPPGVENPVFSFGNAK
jgi:NADPH:quinone reductase-like Zn-dependent oxidoreductase